MAILRKLLNYIYSSNPTQVASTFIHGDQVTYGLIYENDDNGNNKVKLLINPLYQVKSYEWDTGFSISDEFKDQLSLTFIENSPKIDKIGIIFPEEAIDTQGKKYIKGLSFNTYEINQLVSTPVVKPLGTTKLQKNINSKSPANADNSYFQPKATQVEGGGIVVIANNLKKKIAVAWYLKPNKSGIFSTLAGANGIIERNLFKLNDPNSELVLNGNTLLYSQINRKIVGDRKIQTTDISTFDIIEAVNSIKRGKGINEYLLNPNHQTLLFSSENKVNFLRYMAQNKKFAFLESNVLHIYSLNNIDANSSVYEFKSPIEQLYVKEGNIIITAVDEQNVITVHIDHSTEPRVTITPISTIQTRDDFIKIINGQLPPEIASSTSVATITSTPASTITTKQPTTLTSGTTRKRTAAPTKPTIAKEQPITSTTSERTAASTTTKKQSTASTPALTSKSFAVLTTVTELPTTSIYTILNEPTQTVPRRLPRVAIAGNSREIAGSVVGAIVVAGLMIFGAYKYYHRRNLDTSESISDIPLTEVSAESPAEVLSGSPDSHSTTNSKEYYHRRNRGTYESTLGISRTEILAGSSSETSSDSSCSYSTTRSKEYRHHRSRGTSESTSHQDIPITEMLACGSSETSLDDSYSYSTTSSRRETSMIQISEVPNSDSLEGIPPIPTDCIGVLSSVLLGQRDSPNGSIHSWSISTASISPMSADSENINNSTENNDEKPDNICITMTRVSVNSASSQSSCIKL